ncbi:hypothetical protein CBR59_24360 [Bacillus thuringiensis]|uniref:hypothetical protein n=1 Tax=Bacillus cereus group TaxID=86661 RepID=UPI000C9E20E9|nr:MULTISPECIES: hypothetical protein [Bacillus cereus group]PNK24691.1 hypothetical protein CBP87_25785 [Bacillus thuringiensis]PNK52017.1 hypothetical protein CBR59_24360 [Bacillus thuringiensis]TFZ14006.1 hypothetical protein C6Y54_04895 [Bacillus cereus]
MSKLNKRYLEDHMVNIHDYESFGRIIIEQAINQAIQEIGNQDVDYHEINLKLFLSPVESRSCVRVCTGQHVTPDGYVYGGHCVHKNLEM